MVRRATKYEPGRTLYLALYHMVVTGRTQTRKRVTAARILAARRSIQTMQERYAWATPPSKAEIARWRRRAGSA